MGSNLAPGVEIIERSFSTRIEAGDQTVFATMGLFKKGPVNEATRISSPDQLREVFGKPESFLSSIHCEAPCGMPAQGASHLFEL